MLWLTVLQPLLLQQQLLLGELLALLGERALQLIEERYAHRRPAAAAARRATTARRRRRLAGVPIAPSFEAASQFATARSTSRVAALLRLTPAVMRRAAMFGG